MARFGEHVGSLVGKRVRLGRGGPDERKGILLGVRDDYLTLHCEDGSLVHYPLHHLKSVTEMVNSEVEDGIDPASSALIAGLPATLHELVKSFVGLKVQVYDHGPESAAGIVFSVGEDYVQLITTPDEMVHYPFFHIRSIRLTKPKQEQGKGKDDHKGKDADQGGDGGKDRSPNSSEGKSDKKDSSSKDKRKSKFRS